MTYQNFFPSSIFFVHVCILTKELTNKMDLQALNGKTLTVTQDSSSPGLAPTTSSLLCPYVNLLLCNAQPSGEKHVISEQFWRYFFFTPISLRCNIICTELWRAHNFIVRVAGLVGHKNSLKYKVTFSLKNLI